MIKLGFSFLLLLCLYPVSLAVLPIISSRIVLALMGVILFIPNVYYSIVNRKLLINRKMLYAFLALFSIFLFSAFSITYNQTNDLEFLKYPISVIISFLSAYFLYKIISRYKKYRGEFTILTLVIYTIAIQSLISILMFTIPEVQNSIFSVIYLEELQSSKIEVLSEKRIIGFGRSFFLAGIYSGMGLILIGYLIRSYKLNNFQTLWFSFLFAFIFAVGMMMARTTIVGFFLGIAIVFLSNKFISLKISRKAIKFLFMLVAIPFLIVLLIYFIKPSYFYDIEYLTSFAFEIFINFLESGKIETKSSSETLSMLVFPDNIKTWLIGDALWTLDNGNIYYMHTDVGYSRLIFYFGTIGFFLFILFQFILIRLAFNSSFMVFIIIIYFLTLTLKGFSDLSIFLILFLVFNYKYKYSIRNYKVYKS